MADIIDIKDTPQARYRRELDSKDQEIAALRLRLDQVSNGIATIAAINDMLKLQLTDLIVTLTNLHTNFAVTVENMKTLHAQLPDITQQ